MRRARIRRAGLLFVLVFAGCAQLQRPAPTPAPTPIPAPAPPVPAPTPAPVLDASDVQQTVELLDYYQRVAQLGAEDQRRELNTTTQSFNRERSSYNRVRLALLLLIPATGFQDEARAVQLLEPLTTGGGGNLQKLAGLLYSPAGERVKTQKRADQMKDQLDALRAIERSLIERSQQSPPRKP